MRIGRGGVAAAVLLVLLSALAWRGVVDTDYGIHLAGGRWVADHGAVPQTDPFTFTVSDHPTVAYHWLFQLGLYGLHQSGGVALVAAVRALLLIVTALLLLDALRGRGVSPLPGALVGLLVLLASEWRFTPRPELVSWLLSAATLCLAERHRAGRTAPLWLLLPIQLVWVNTHVFVVGFGILAAYALEDVWRRRTLRTPLLGWSAAALLVTLLNPYGLTAVTYPILLATRLSGDNLFAQHIGELASPLRIAPDARQPFSTGPALSAYRLLLPLSLAALVVHLRDRRLADFVLVLVFGALSLLAVRNVPLAAIVLLLPLCTAADRLLGLTGGSPPPVQRIAADCLLVCVLGYALLLVPRVVSGSYYAADWRSDHAGTELCGPCLGLETADWLATRPIAGRGFNSLSIGGTLTWRDPARPIFIDARNEVTGEDFYAVYQQALRRGDLDVLAKRHGLEYAVLHHRGGRTAALAGALHAESGWRLVHLDGGGAIFVRTDGPNRGIPAAPLPAPVSEAERRAALEAAAVAIDARSDLLGWLWSRERAPGAAFHLGRLLLSAGEPAAAERPLLEAARLHPSRPEVHETLARAYTLQGRSQLAADVLARARQLAPNRSTKR